MESVIIQIQSLEDANKGGKVFMDAVEPDQEVKQGKLTHMAILEGGQESGKTSIMFLVQEGGQKIIVQCTQDILRGMASALEGAIQRFGK